MCSAPYRGRKSFSSYCYDSEGGQNVQNAGRFWFFGAIFRGVSLKSHWRLSGFQSCPLPVFLNHFVPLLSTSYAEVVCCQYENCRSLRDESAGWAKREKLWLTY